MNNLETRPGMTTGEILRMDEDRAKMWTHDTPFAEATGARIYNPENFANMRLPLGKITERSYETGGNL